MTSGPPMQRVLVVDDEPPIRRFLRTSLSSHGYQVIEAEDGPSARAALRQNAVDVVVLEVVSDLGTVELVDGLVDFSAFRC